MRKHVIAIGASTGGTEALLRVLSGMPRNAPPIVIVQHMPGPYLGPFAKRLNALCEIEVHEAGNGDAVRAGLALVAPSDLHMRLGASDTGYQVHLTRHPRDTRHMPSVDVLFDSVAETAAQHGIGIILTGMGTDGARGLRAMRDAGAQTFGQDQHSCVVYGMPKAAKRIGAVQTEAPLAQISELALKACGVPTWQT